MKIKEIRIQKGLSQEALAKKINVSQQAVASWESGSRSPSSTKIPALAAALECTINDLYQ